MVSGKIDFVFAILCMNETLMNIISVATAGRGQQSQETIVTGMWRSRNLNLDLNKEANGG